MGLDSDWKNHLKRVGAIGFSAFLTETDFVQAFTDCTLAELAANTTNTLEPLLRLASLSERVKARLQKPFPSTGSESQQKEWLLSRMAALHVLDDQIRWLKKTESASQITLSLSHTTFQGDCVGLAVSSYDVEVGCDVENRARAISSAVLTRVGAPSNGGVPAWVMREAAVKCQEGLLMGDLHEETADTLVAGEDRFLVRASEWDEWVVGLAVRT